MYLPTLHVRPSLRYSGSMMLLSKMQLHFPLSVQLAVPLQSQCWQSERTQTYCIHFYFQQNEVFWMYNSSSLLIVRCKYFAIMLTSTCWISAESTFALIAIISIKTRLAFACAIRCLADFCSSF